MAAQDLENGLEWINLVCVWPKLRWHCWEQRVLFMGRWWGSLWVQPQFLTALCPVPWVWDGSWQADWSCVTALCLMAVTAAGILCQMGSSQVDGFWLVSWEHMKEIQLWMQEANGMAVPASVTVKKLWETELGLELLLQAQSHFSIQGWKVKQSRLRL